MGLEQLKVTEDKIKADRTPSNREMLMKLGAALGIAPDQEYTAEVVRSGDKIILPDDASIPEIIKVLAAEYEAEEQDIEVSVTLPVAPWDGAIALQKALNAQVGLVQARETQLYFMGMPMGKQKPQELTVEIEYGKTMTISWGTFALPGLGPDAKVETGMRRNQETGFVEFAATIKCKRKYQERARRIFDSAQVFAREDSIHKGKAFSLAFHNSEGESNALPMPRFFPLDTDPPVFRRELELAVERNIFTPLRHSEELIKMGEPLKRGALFAGKYGTGKTMLATYIARVATENGWSFIYVRNSAELPEALRYALRYQPAVVFAEDVDRVAGTSRTDDVNALLNQLDGVDSKSSKIMTLLTTNHPEMVNEAMRRPGRIDMILQVLPPDAEAAGRMIKQFARGSLEEGTDLTEASKTLDGMAPAHIRETVGRARLEALRRTGLGTAKISGADLATVALEVKAETELFVQKAEVTPKLMAMAEGFKAAGDIIHEVHEEQQRQQKNGLSRYSN